MRKALKVFLAIGIVLLSLFMIAMTVYFAITAGTNLQPEKLVDYGKTIAVFDDQANLFEDASLETGQKSVKIENLSKDTLNAFIASEDRSFYTHNGLNFRRMAKAMYKNILSRSFKEGASTISQQLIKNTHLSSDKTINRKLKEIKLTRQLERRYSKDEILEMYLNTIYFGHRCFGLQSAADFYFGKPASELTLEQSATLVGLLTSPNNFSPFKNPKKSLARRNIVLKNMLDCAFIDENRYSECAALPLSACENCTRTGNSDYLNGVFNEFEELNLDPYGQFTQLNVMTYFNKDIQNCLNEARAESDYSYFVRTNEGGVAAVLSTIGNARRQIGSTAKPLFTYAPAIEGKKVHPFTQIEDEPINYGGYSPENYDKRYHGKVSVTDSIVHSYNVPAVKTMNMLDLDDVEKYADKMSVDLDDGDKNLSLALGAMKDGLTLKELCDCYSTFANGGKFRNSAYIKEITDQNGKVLYRRALSDERVFSEGTCSLITDALRETVKRGTAKNIKQNFDVACKTGTCGNSEGNTDAYAVAYTSTYCFGVWLGNKDNARGSFTGGRDCCKILNGVLNGVYRDKGDSPLDVTSGTTEVAIDREEYETNGKILLSDPVAPKLNVMRVRCLRDNVPTEQTTRFSLPTIRKPSIIVKNNEISISLYQTKYYTYLIKRKNGSKSEVIYNGAWLETVTDLPPDGEYEYSVTPIFSTNGKNYYGKEIMLPQVLVRKQKSDSKLPDIAFKDWYNQ